MKHFFSSALNAVGIAVVAACTTLGLATPAVAQGTPTVAPDDWASDAAVVLVRQSDHTSLEVTAEDYAFSSERITVGADDTLEELLASRGIYPDAEAMGAVYRLNPLLDSTVLAPGTEVVLPKIEGEDLLEQSIDEGFLAAITLDMEAKRHLLETTDTVKALAVDVYALAPPRFAEVEAPDTLIGHLSAVEDFLGALSVVTTERSRPLNAEMLRQVNGEADLLRGILEERIATGSAFTRADEETIALVAESMQLRADHFQGARGPGEPPPPYPEEEVVVEVLAPDGTPVNQLRVYFVPVALYGQANAWRPSREFTSPVKERLPVANYRVWAGKPNDPTPLTDVFGPLRLTKSPTGSTKVQLMVQ